MAFPSVESITETSFSSASTTHNVSMPATVNSGDLLLILFCAHASGTTTHTEPTDWSTVFDFQDGGGYGHTSCYAKIADGDEDSTTVNVATSAARAASAHVYRITGHSGALTAVESATTTGNGTRPNPPNLAPSWGSADTLWIAGWGTADDDIETTGWSANYTGNQTDTACGGGGNSSGRIASATRELAAASDNPGEGIISSSESQMAFTIAIRPSAGGGGTGFEQAVSGSITPSGSLSTQVNFNANVAGTSTPTGALSKRTRTSASGSSTPTGAVLKTVKASVVGSITPTGDMLKAIKTSLTGSTTPLGQLYVTWKQAVAGSTTPSGTVNGVLVVKNFLGGVMALLRRRRKAP